MGFFNKLLGRKKKKDDPEPRLDEGSGKRDEPEGEKLAASEPESKAEPKSKLKPDRDVEASTRPEPEPEAEPEPELDSEPEPAAPQEPSSERGSGEGVVRDPSGPVRVSSSGASLRAMSSGSLQAAASTIQCDNCERDLPVPLATGVTVTCPFCLGRTTYKP